MSLPLFVLWREYEVDARYAKKVAPVGGTLFVISALFHPDVEFGLASDRPADRGPVAGFAGQACQLRSRHVAACFAQAFLFFLWAEAPKEQVRKD
jgi:hypothetical protein